MSPGQRIERAGLTAAERLAFTVAERLGMTVGDVLERMTTAEIIQWLRLPQTDKRLADEQSLRELVERYGRSR